MATTRKTTADATASFIVQSNLSFDGDDYAPGDPVELTEAQALELGPDVVLPAPAAAAKG